MRPRCDCVALTAIRLAVILWALIDMARAALQ